MANPQDFTLKRTYSGAPVLEGPEGERLDLGQYRTRLQELLEEEAKSQVAAQTPASPVAPSIETPALPEVPAPAEVPSEEALESVFPALGVGADALIRAGTSALPGTSGTASLVGQAAAPAPARQPEPPAPLDPVDPALKSEAPAFSHVPIEASDFTPVLKQETTFSGPKFRWKGAFAPTTPEQREEQSKWNRYVALSEIADKEELTEAAKKEYFSLAVLFAGKKPDKPQDAPERRQVNPLGQVKDGTMVEVSRPGPQGDMQRGFRPAQGYVWDDPSDPHNLRVRKQTSRDPQTRVQFKKPDAVRDTPKNLEVLTQKNPPPGWELPPDVIDEMVESGGLDAKFRNDKNRVWRHYRARELKKSNQTNAEAALTAHALRLRDPETLAITTALLEEGLPLVNVGTDVAVVDQTKMLRKLVYKYSISEEKKLQKKGASITDLSEKDLEAFHRTIEEKAVRAMSHILALTRFAATDSFDPNITDRIMEKNVALRPIYAAAAPPAWYTPAAERLAGTATSPSEAAEILGDVRAIPRQIDQYTGLSKWGRVLGFTSTALAGVLEAPDAAELFEVDWDGGMPSIHTSYGSRPVVDAIRRGADPFDHITDWGQMFLGVTDNPGTAEHLVGTGALLLYTFVEPEPISPLLATAGVGAKAARYATQTHRISKADRLLKKILLLEERGEDAASLMKKLEKADPSMAALISSGTQQGLGVRGVGSRPFERINALIDDQKKIISDLRADAEKRAKGVIEALPGEEAARAELDLLQREFQLSRLLEAAAAARKNSALHVAGLSMEEAATVTTPKTLKGKKTVLQNAETVFRERRKAASKALSAFKGKGQKAEQTVTDARKAFDETLQENIPSVAPAAARTKRGAKVRADWYPLTETDEAGNVVGTAELTVQKKDIIAEIAPITDNRGKTVLGPKPPRMGAVGKVEGCVVNRIHIGTRVKVPRPGRLVGKLPKKASQNRKFEVLLEVTDPNTGRVFIVRHPMSNLSAAEGGLNLQQAKNIVRQQTNMIELNNLNAADVIKYHQLQKNLAYETANLKQLRTRDPLIRPIENYQKAARARIRIEAKLKKRARQLGAKKGDIKTYTAAVNKHTNTVAKEARALQEQAQLQASKDIFRTTVDNVRAGLAHEKKLFRSAVGSPFTAPFTKTMAEILNYDTLSPTEVQDSVVRISGKAISNVTEEGEGTVNLHRLFEELKTETNRTGARAEDLIIDRGATLLPTALKKIREGASTMDLAPGEVGRLQAELQDAIKASHKFETRLKDSAAVYGGIWKANMEFHKLTRRNWLGNIRRHLWGLASGKDPINFARMLKRAQVGAMSDEMLDSAIAADRILDLGLQELVALSKGGSMPEEEMIPLLIGLFDRGIDEARAIFGADKFGGGQEEIFLEVIGGTSRFQNGKAQILADVRVDPLDAAVDKAAVDNLRARISRILEDPIVAKELGADAAALGDLTDEVLSTLMRVTNEADRSGDLARPLAIISRAFFGSGAKGARAAPELTAVAYRLLLSSDSFGEFTTKMSRATAAITNHAPSGGFAKDAGVYYGGKAYAKVASAFVLASTQGWLVRQVNKALYAPITVEQAVSINRIFTGAVPRLKKLPEDANKAQRLAAQALDQKEVDDAFRALADMGMSPSEVAIKGEEAVASSRAVAEKAKLLYQVAEDGTGMNAFVPRRLMNELGRDLDRLINKLIPETPVGLDPASLPGQALNKMGSSFSALSSIWRTSVTTGLFLPNPGYWGNMHMGDLSQMIFGEGWRTATKVSFNNSLSYLPYVGRGLNDMALRAAARNKSALPTLVESMLNPWLGKLFAGEDFVVTGKNGIQMHSTKLKQMLVEDGIMGTYVNQELVDLFSNALDNTPRGALLRGWRGRNYTIANHANLLQQRQRAGLYLELVINKGVPRAEAARRTLEALYDWKHGVTRLEAAISTNYIPFLRFWALAMRQMAGAAVEPLTKSVGRSFLDAATGRTKIARLGQQIRVFGGVPEMLGLDNEEAQGLESFYASILPTYMETRGMLGYGGLPADSSIRDWYLRETGRDYDGLLWMLPTATCLDTATMYRGAITGVFALGARAAQVFGSDVQIPRNWEADILEPILNTTSPVAQTVLRQTFSTIPGVNLDYYSRSGYRNLSYAEEIVLSPGKWGIPGIDTGIDIIPDSWNFPMQRDMETGRMKMDLWAYTLSGMIPGLMTQAPRWVKALKNPGMEEGWKEYAKWVAGSLTRYGAPTPYSGRKTMDTELRRVNTGFSAEMKGVGDIYTGARKIDDD